MGERDVSLYMEQYQKKMSGQSGHDRNQHYVGASFESVFWKHSQLSDTACGSGGECAGLLPGAEQEWFAREPSLYFRTDTGGTQAVRLGGESGICNCFYGW